MKSRSKPVLFTKNSYEFSAWKQESAIIGLDEVGRGCLAGPLVAGAVALPPHTPQWRLSRVLKDSKVLSEKGRESAYQWIIAHCRYGIGIAHPRAIDTHNIWQATLIAMKKALAALFVHPGPAISTIVVDAMPLKIPDMAYNNVPIHFFPKGESKSGSIAAASILAKVTRDRIMTQLDAVFPGYELACHKGYGTPKHQNALFEQGHSLNHRLSFLKKLTLSRQDDRGKQCHIG